MIKVRAHTCYLGKTGFAAHSRAFFRELSKHVDLRVRNFTWDDDPDYLNEVDYSILDLITLSDRDGSHREYPISGSYPNRPWRELTDFSPDVEIVLMDNEHYYFYEEYAAPVKIAYAVWESTLLPEGFFQRLLTFDHLWVVTDWHRQRAIEQGYPAHRVHVVNEAVDLSFCGCPSNEASAEYADGRFKFLFFGRWDYRKSVPEIIQSFLRAFPDNEPVDLVLSADNPYAVDGMHSTEERLAHYGFNDSRIKVKHFPKRTDYEHYMKKGNVMVTCARSEGWNIPLIEAMGMGTPSIYSDWGGQLEFARGKGLPVRIAELRDAAIGAHLGFAGNTPGQYAEPDFDHLVEVMRYAYENYDEVKLRALEDAQQIKADFTWERVGLDAFNILQDLTGIRDITPVNEAAIIMSHADTPQKVSYLENCVKNLKQQGYTVIISSHIEVPVSAAAQADVVVVDHDNPVIYSDEFESLSNTVPVHYIRYPEFNISYSFDFNHGLAALRLIKNGLRIAQGKGLSISHCINYDYLIQDRSLLRNHSSHLEDFCVKSYTWKEPWTLNSGLFSGRTADLIEAFQTIDTKQEYFKYQNKTILEEVIYESLMEHGKTVHLESIDSIKQKNLLNQHILDTYPQIHLNGDTGFAYLCRSASGEYYLGVCTNSGPMRIQVEYAGQVETIEAKMYPMYFYRVSAEMLQKGFRVLCPEAHYRNEYRAGSKHANCTINNQELIRDFNFKREEQPAPEIIVHFVQGPFVEIKSPTTSIYHVTFRDKKKGEVVFQTTIGNNCWARCNRRYWTDWSIEVIDIQNNKRYDYTFNARGKRVLFSLGSKSLGDNIAWFPHIEEFCRVHGCKAVVSTFKNELFEKEYPEMQFVQPGINVPGIYASFDIGWFYKDNEYNADMHPRDFKPLSMQETTTDILGLPASTLKPRISLPHASPRPIEEKYVCLGIHSTAQAKYWNNPTGWQEVTDYFKSQGYRVVVLSTEPDGYMGNAHPKGAETIAGPRTLQGTLQYLIHAELFIGVGSGLSWLSWAAGAPTVIISGFSKPHTEVLDANVLRIFNESVCNGCFNRSRLDAADWHWCPDLKTSPRQFECTTSIRGSYVIEKIKEFMAGANDDYIVRAAVQKGYEQGMTQNYSEIYGAAKFVKDLDVKDFIEIGTDRGGTFATWSQLAADGMRISVDMPHGNWGNNNYSIEERDNQLRSLGSNVHMLHGSSHDSEMLERVESLLAGKQVDFLFIDGDHSYEGVKQDYEMYKKLVKPGGWIGFHDIKDTEFHRKAQCRVDLLWNELSGEKVEFLEKSSEYGGIGFIRA